MTATSPHVRTARNARLGARLLGVALAGLWTGLALAAHGTALAGPTLWAALASIAGLAWLARLHGAAPNTQDPRLDCATLTALLEATLDNDLTTALGHGARLLAAQRLWLRIEAPLAARTLDWPPSAAAAAPSWWRESCADDVRWCDDCAATGGCAVSLRHRDVRLGVLAIERVAGARPFSHRDQQTATAVATLLTHVLLSDQLKARLDELGEQQTRERRMFLSGLSHKLRTPMTAILGFAQILALDDSLAGEHREFVREIESAGQSLLDMLNELVGVTRE